MANYIKEFLDEDYTQYAVYRVFQRLPHILDTLGQTQRKILFSLEKFPDNKKFKTTEVYSKVYDLTSYLHGDQSVYTVVENLARECSNNLSLLTAEGSFGSRTSKNAAAPRYTSTRFSQAARLVFRREDHPILIQQEFEGKTIENKFLLPIIPVSLLNGYNAIAVGFASKFLPRHPVGVIEALQDALRYRKRKNTDWEEFKFSELVPAFPFYSGTITKDASNKNPSAWLLTGRIQKTKTRNIIEVVDLPPEANREGYVKKLKKFQERGIIKDWSEKCVKNRFLFQIKVTPEIFKKDESELLSLLGLIDKTSENFTFLNPDGKGDETVLKFETVSDYLKIFLEQRLEWYDIRKRYQLDKLQEELLILKEKIRFIQMVNSESIIIIKRKKADLEKELQNIGFQKIEESFDYLLGMRMYALTEENIKKFEKSIQEKEKELKQLEKLTPEDIHMRELEELKKFINPELKKKELI